MSNYITLMGAEDVSRAGYNMQSAARDMNSAASNMSFTFEQHQRFLDDWLMRFADMLQEQLIK